MRQFFYFTLFIILLCRECFPEEIGFQDIVAQTLTEELNSENWLENVKKLRLHLKKNPDIRNVWLETLQNFFPEQKSKHEFTHLCAQIGFRYPLEVNQIRGFHEESLGTAEHKPLEKKGVKAITEKEIQKARKDPNFYAKLFKKYVGFDLFSKEVSFNIDVRRQIYNNSFHTKAKFKKHSLLFETIDVSFLVGEAKTETQRELNDAQNLILFTNTNFNLRNQDHQLAKTFVAFLRAEHRFSQKLHNKEAIKLYDEVIQLNNINPLVILSHIRKLEILCENNTDGISNKKKNIKQIDKKEINLKKAIELINLIKKNKHFLKEKVNFLHYIEAKIYLGDYGHQFKNLEKAKIALKDLTSDEKYLNIAFILYGKLYAGVYGSDPSIPQEIGKKLAFRYLEKGLAANEHLAAMCLQNYLINHPNFTDKHFRDIIECYKSQGIYDFVVDLYAKNTRFYDIEKHKMLSISAVISYLDEDYAIKLAEDYFNEGHPEDAVHLLSKHVKIGCTRQSYFVLGNILTNSRISNTYNLKNGVHYYGLLLKNYLIDLTCHKLFKLIEKTENIDDIKIILSLYDKNYLESQDFDSVKKYMTKFETLAIYIEVIHNKLTKHFTEKILPELMKKQNPENGFKELIEEVCPKIGVPVPSELYETIDVSSVTSTSTSLPETFEIDEPIIEEIEEEESVEEPSNEEEKQCEAPILQTPQQVNLNFIKYKIQTILIALKNCEELTFDQMLKLTEWLGGRAVTAAKDHTKITFFLPGKEPFKMHKFHTGNMKDASIKVSKAGYIKRWKALIREILEERNIWDHI